MSKNKVVNYVAIALAVICYLALTIKAVVIFNDVFNVIIFSFLGLLLITFLNAVFHEIGHLIAGKIVGLKLVSIKILWFNFDFSSKKVVFNLEKATNLGETVFVPKSQDNLAKKTAISILGGIISTLILLVVGLILLWFFYDKNLYVCTLFATPTVVTLYYLTINLIGEETCDGNMIVNVLSEKSEGREIISNALYVGGLLYSGVLPSEIPNRYLSEYREDYSLFSSMIIYYRYLSILGSDKEYAFKEIVKLSNREKLKDSIYDTIMCELYYISYFKNDKLFLENNQYIIEKIVEYDDSLGAVRAHTVLRLVKGDKEWAKVIVESTLSRLEKLVDGGLNKLEKQLFLELKEITNN